MNKARQFQASNRAPDPYAKLRFTYGQPQNGASVVGLHLKLSETAIAAKTLCFGVAMGRYRVAQSR